MKVWTAIEMSTAVHFLSNLPRKLRPFPYIREDIALQDIFESSKPEFSHGTRVKFYVLSLCNKNLKADENNYNFQKIRKDLELTHTHMVP